MQALNLALANNSIFASRHDAAIGRRARSRGHQHVASRGGGFGGVVLNAIDEAGGSGPSTAKKRGKRRRRLASDATASRQPGKAGRAARARAKREKRRALQRERSSAAEMAGLKQDEVADAESERPGL